MPLNKKQFNRLSIIHDTLVSFNRFTFTELLKKVNNNSDISANVSKRTLINDINFLKELGAPLEDRKRYYQYSAPFSLYEILNPTEKNVFKEALSLLKKIEKTNQFHSLLPEISAFLLRFKSDSSLENKIVFYEDNPSYTGLEYLADFYTYILQNKVLDLQYVDFEKNRFTFIFHPYVLKQYSNRWYVYGYTEAEKKIYVLPLDRIRQVKLKEGIKYKENLDFNPPTFFSEMIGIGRLDDQMPQRIVVRVYGQSVDFMSTKKIHQSQEMIAEEENYADFSFFLIDNFEFRSKILALGANAEVMEPLMLRESFSVLTKEMKSRYLKKTKRFK